MMCFEILPKDREPSFCVSILPNKKDGNVQRYITLEELRTKLGNRSRSSIYSDIKAGRLSKPLKFGGRVLWPEDELEDHLRALRNGDIA